MLTENKNANYNPLFRLSLECKDNKNLTYYYYSKKWQI